MSPRGLEAVHLPPDPQSPTTTLAGPPPSFSPGGPAQILDHFVQDPTRGWTMAGPTRIAALLAEADELLELLPDGGEGTPLAAQRASIVAIRHLLDAYRHRGQEITQDGADDLHDTLQRVRAARFGARRW